MGISFDMPIFLAFLLPCIILLVWWWRTQTRVSGLKRYIVMLLRSLFLLLLVLAIAGLNLLFPVKGETVVFVVDSSASMNQDSRILLIIREAVRTKHPLDQYAIVSVGAEAAIEQPITTRKEVASLGVVVNPHATNLGEGIRLASGLIPSQARGKIVLLTDGVETHGDASKEIKLAQERGIQVDAFYLQQEQGAEVALTSLHIPGKLYLGEEYQVKLNVESTIATKGIIRLYEGNAEVAQLEVDIEKGTNQFAFLQKTEQEGYQRYRAELQAVNDTIQVNNQAYSFSEVSGKPKVLIVEGTEGAATNLINALQAGNIEAHVKPAAMLPKELDGFKPYSSIILANLQATQIKVEDMKRIQTAVRDLGLGLIMTGGPNSFGMGGWFKTPIEEALPVHMDLRSKEELPSLGLALVIDKSGSMAPGFGEVNKMELAKEAALRATEMLHDQDQISVVAFDSAPWVVVEMQSVTNLEEIQDQISSIYPDGGTEIYTALAEGYEQVKQATTQRKHIILLTDGISGYADYESLTEEVKEDNITVSTVAVGDDADTSLLEEIAEMGNGRFYFVNDPETLPQIFSQETAMASRTFIVEKPHIPSYVGARDWTVLRNQLPFIHAYMATTPKQTAQTALLSLDQDPILTRWQYGLGRSVAWTTDLEGKWAPEWIGWEGNSRMWSQIVSWTFPQVASGTWQTETVLDGIKGRVTVSLPVGSELPQQMEAIVLNHRMEREVVQLKPIAPGKLQAEFNADEPGTYLLQVIEKQGEQIISNSTSGLTVAYSPEYRITPSAEDTLVSWTELGKGAMLTAPVEVFTGDLPHKWENQNISDWLLLLATLIWPIDIAVRRVQIPSTWKERWNQLLQRREKNKVPSEKAAVLGQLNVKKDKLVQKKIPLQQEQSERRQQSIEPKAPASLSANTHSLDTGNRNAKAGKNHHTNESADTFNRLLEAKKRNKK